MNTETHKEALWGTSHNSNSPIGRRSSSTGTREGALASLAAEGPRPGLLYQFQLPGMTFTLLWALVRVLPDEPGFLAVPADDNPLAGGDDVEVPESSGTGPLTLRCGYSTYILTRDLESATLAGWIDQPQLQQAHEAILAVASGRRRGGFAVHEVEATAEYEGWIARIAHAEVTLTELLEQRHALAAVPETEATFEDSL